MHGHTRTRRRRHAFTLIEILVVIAIIAVLVSITLVVGASVVRGGKARLTTDTIRSLDGMLATYVGDHDQIPDARVGHPDDVREYENGVGDLEDVRQIPVADARWERREVMINAVGLFVWQAEQAGMTDMLGGMDDRLVGVYSPETDGTVAASQAFPQLTTVFDAWNRPIRYVHPKLDGQIVRDKRAKGSPGFFTDVADTNSGFFYDPGGSRRWLDGSSSMPIRRNAITEAELDADPALADEADGDGGLAASGRPYFYSAGEDGNPATRDGNVYAVQPKFVEQDL